MKSSFRKWKNRLHKKYNLYSTAEERFKHVPEDLSANTWKEMSELFRKPEFQEQSATNSGTCAHLTCVATTCPVPFAEVKYEMIDEGELPKASEVWMATHRISDEHGQKLFWDSKSREIYEDMRRIGTEARNEERERQRAESSQLEDDQFQSVVRNVNYLLQLNNLRTGPQNGLDDDSSSIDKSQ